MPIDPFGYEEPVFYGLPYVSQEPYGYYDNYEPPWLTLAREGIRRGAETAQIVASGYPSYPQYPTPGSGTAPPPVQPVPLPAPAPSPLQSQSTVNIPTGLLILGVGGILLFMLGKGRR